MKKIIALATLALSFNILASEVLVEVKAHSVDSSTKYSTHQEARECTYSLINRGATNGGLHLFLNSDSDSEINISADLSRTKLPLKEGTNDSGYNDITIVKTGSIVTITEKREAMGYGSIYDVVTLDISSDLKKIKSGKYENFMTNMIGMKKLQEEMTCQF